MDYQTVGYFASSLSGHDKGTLYVIIRCESDYVYLSDGRLRTVDKPKKKKLKHVQIIKRKDDNIADRLEKNLPITNETVKYAIKKLNKEQI